MPPFFIYRLKVKKSQSTFLLLLYVIFFSSLSYSQDDFVTRHHLAFSYDRLTLPENEKMGLVGGNYLFSIGDYFYTGLGVYGAVDGIRGGFFTGGLTTGIRFNFRRAYYSDINAFVGGGGGGAAPQGGGLMLRTSIEAGRYFGSNSLGLGYSYIDFPNGDITSHQLALNYRYSFSTFHLPGWASKTKDQEGIFLRQVQNLKLMPRQFSVQLTHYFPVSSVARSGKSFDNRLDILGIRWRSNWKGNYWFEFETGGAMLGNIDGFAQVLSGFSYEHMLSRNIRSNYGFMLGAAGGGDVNTGGGSIYRVFAGLSFIMNKHWSILTQIAWTAAVENKFRAATGLINLVYHYQGLASTNKSPSSKRLTLSKKINWRKIRVRPGIQRYSHYYGSGRKSQKQKNLDVNLVNLKLDSFINPHFYVTGHAIGAIAGKAGGYAVGLVGPGLQLNSIFSAELLGGVAGGGGIAVGSGQIVQPMINLTLPINDAWQYEASIGYIKAINAELSAVVTNMAISYRFRKPYLH